MLLQASSKHKNDPINIEERFCKVFIIIYDGFNLWVTASNIHLLDVTPKKPISPKAYIIVLLSDNGPINFGKKVQGPKSNISIKHDLNIGDIFCLWAIKSNDTGIRIFIQPAKNIIQQRKVGITSGAVIKALRTTASSMIIPNAKRYPLFILEGQIVEVPNIVSTNATTDVPRQYRIMEKSQTYSLINTSMFFTA